VLNALRSHENRPYLRVLALALLVSWVSMLVSASCAMPRFWRGVPADAMPTGCSEAPKHSPTHPGHSLPQGCSFKLCLDATPTPVFEFNVDIPNMPVFALCLFWLIGCLFRHLPSPLVPRTTAPPCGRRIPLIYRFCTLLN
jgi:hypothetical protein